MPGMLSAVMQLQVMANQGFSPAPFMLCQRQLNSKQGASSHRVNAVRFTDLTVSFQHELVDLRQTLLQTRCKLSNPAHLRQRLNSAVNSIQTYVIQLQLLARLDRDLIANPHVVALSLLMNAAETEAAQEVQQIAVDMRQSQTQMFETCHISKCLLWSLNSSQRQATMKFVMLVIWICPWWML